MTSKIVGVVGGSRDDLSILRSCCKTLKQLKIPFITNIVSAFHTPVTTQEYAREAENNGLAVIIAGFKGSPQLANALATFTHIPVIGVPTFSMFLAGLDVVMSLAQVQPKMPIAIMPAATDGAVNAALYAASILSITDNDVKEALLDYRRRVSQEIASQNEAIPEELAYGDV